jgi:hypothetical protein
MVVPPVSLAAVLQGTALTVCVETSSGATLSKPGPVSISGKAVGCKSVPRRALAAGGPYRLTPSCRSQQKQHLYDLARERRFIAAEPFEHVAIEIDKALETKRQDSRRVNRT